MVIRIDYPFENISDSTFFCITYSQMKAANESENKLICVFTNDGQEFKVSKSLLTTYSLFFAGILEDGNIPEDIKVLEADSETFKEVLKFLQLHKDKAPLGIKYPLKGGFCVNEIMEDDDARFITSLLNKQDELELFKKVLNASAYLQIEDLKKRLMAGLTIKLLAKTSLQVQEELNLRKSELNLEQMRRECRQKLAMVEQQREERSNS